MSIILSTLVFPLALSGMPPEAVAHSAKSPAATAQLTKFVTPVKSPVVIVPPAAAPKASGAELIRIQQPAPAPQGAAPAAVDKSAIIDRVSKALTDVRTAQGNFSQTDARGKFSSGAFYINRPGRVRFEYTAPEPIYIVSDGVTVSMEEPKRKSYESGPLSASTLHLFLRSNVDLKRDGSVTDVTSSNGSHFVTLVDKSGEAQGKMILEFRASDFELLGWRVLDGGGAETKVKLTDTKKNVTLKPSLFVVKDPADDRR